MDLKTYLWRHRITQNEFARRCGITRQSVSAYVRGFRRPRYEAAAKIQAATEGAVSILELMSNDYSNELQENWIAHENKEKTNGINMQISL